MTNLRIPVAVLLVLLLTACPSANSTIKILNTILTSAETLLPIITAGAGLDANLQKNLSNYLHAASGALVLTSDILNTNGSAAVKASQVTTAWAGVTAPILPAGTPQRVVSLVQAISSAITNLLQQFAPTPAAPGAPSARVPKPIVVSASDAARLLEIRGRAVAIKDSTH